MRNKDFIRSLRETNTEKGETGYVYMSSMPGKQLTVTKLKCRQGRCS